MKRLISILLLILTVIFTSACHEETMPGHGSILVENECLETTFSREDDEGYVYILNIVTKKYHLQTCEYAVNMKEENRYETASMHYIMAREYQPCKICIGG